MKSPDRLRSHIAEVSALAEERLVHEKLWAALVEGELLTKFATWLLAFEGGAAAIVLANPGRLEDLAGRRALSIALAILAVCVFLGILARWIGHTLQVEKQFRVTEREAIDSILEGIRPSIQLSEPEIRALLDEHEDDMEGGLSAVLNELKRRAPDLDAAQRRAYAQYRDTLGLVTRWWQDKQIEKASGDPNWNIRRFLRRQHIQWRLLLVQLALILFLVGCAAYTLAFRNRQPVQPAIPQAAATEELTPTHEQDQKGSE